MHCLEHLTTSTLFACDENYLDLNETKTKELIRDFRKACDHPKPGVIHAETIERMDSYKYSGTSSIPNSGSIKTESIVKRGQQRILLMRKLNSFNVSETVLCSFYYSFILL